MTIAQAGLLFASVVITFLTLRDSRAARREEADRFREMRESEERRRRAEIEKRRMEDRESRLQKVVDAIADHEEVRGRAFAGDQIAWARAGSMKVRLQAAVLATGRTLEKTDAYVTDSNPFADLQLLQPALDELQEMLRLYAEWSHLPFQGETG